MEKQALERQLSYERSRRDSEFTVLERDLSKSTRVALNAMGRLSRGQRASEQDIRFYGCMMVEMVFLMPLATILDNSCSFTIRPMAL